MAVGANETVVPASELPEAIRRIKQLEDVLGRKTLKNEILKEAVNFIKAKTGLNTHQYCPAASGDCRLLCPWRVAQLCVGQDRSPVRMDRFEKVTTCKDDSVIKQAIANVVKDRATYGYRRVWARLKLDCCEREIMSWVATTKGIYTALVGDLMMQAVENRFSPKGKPSKPIEWLKDNYSC
jgi:transposase InsO family protein